MNTAAQALVLAAGRGERMRPLTDHTPKPLLTVRGRPLIAWHLQALQRDGVRRVVVNSAWLGPQLRATLDAEYGHQGKHNGRTALSNSEQLSIQHSAEDLDFGAALETAGGIVRALPLLQDTFWLVAADIFVPDFVFDAAAHQRFAAGDDLAHLWLVPNPPLLPRGDFGIDAAGRACDPPTGDATPRLTYSTIALLRRTLFTPPWCDIEHGNPNGVKAPLAPILRAAMGRGRIGATLYTGAWTDVGTPERLAALNAA